MSRAVFPSLDEHVQAPSETIAIGKAAFYKQASMEDLVAAYEYGKVMLAE